MVTSETELLITYLKLVLDMEICRTKNMISVRFLTKRRDLHQNNDEGLFWMNIW